jgi:hypothetical protein
VVAQPIFKRLVGAIAKTKKDIASTFLNYHNIEYMAEAKDILDKIKDLKTTSDSDILKRSRGTISGAFIGMAGGLLLGLNRNYNLISSALVGALIGGIVSHLILPKTNADEND